MHEEEPTGTSLEDETRPSFSNVNPDFTELTIPHITSQSELNDRVRKLSLSKIRRDSWLLVYSGGIVTARC
jgi:hypothetical protein